jgi:hypothetical protein
MRKSNYDFLRPAALLACAFLSHAAAQRSDAASISLGLTCVLNGLGGPGTCAAGPSFGTVTLTDLSGVDAGKVEVAVDLGMGGTQKFRDFMLNYTGAATTIADTTDAGNSVVLAANTFSISPYGGTFDVGANDSQGWNATTSGPYVAVLSGNAPLSVADFTALDTGGNLYAAMHIQDIGSASGGDCDGSGDKPACVPGMNGSGSLKIGAPIILPGTGGLPEPASLCLAGIAATVLGLVRRRN